MPNDNLSEWENWMTQAIAETDLKTDKPFLTPAQLENALSLLVGLSISALLAYGWLHRADRWINPESGIGYGLGIFGGSMMLLLLLYPLRKRVRWLSFLGKMNLWFRAHMVLGVLAPSTGSVSIAGLGIYDIITLPGQVLLIKNVGRLVLDQNGNIVFVAGTFPTLTGSNVQGLRTALS